MEQSSKVYESDGFRLYCHKILPCSKRTPHDWATCFFAHPGEKAKRRNIRTHQYDCEMCPEAVKGQECKLGSLCPHAHNVFESWLHPQKYRTMMCKDRGKCSRAICFFAHGPHELRTPTDIIAQPQQHSYNQAGDSRSSAGSAAELQSAASLPGSTLQSPPQVQSLPRCAESNSQQNWQLLERLHANSSRTAYPMSSTSNVSILKQQSPAPFSGSAPCMVSPTVLASAAGTAALAVDNGDSMDNQHTSSSTSPAKVLHSRYMPSTGLPIGGHTPQSPYGNSNYSSSTLMVQQQQLLSCMASPQHNNASLMAPWNQQVHHKLLRQLSAAAVAANSEQVNHQMAYSRPMQWSTGFNGLTSMPAVVAPPELQAAGAKIAGSNSAGMVHLSNQTAHLAQHAAGLANQPTGSLAVAQMLQAALARSSAAGMHGIRYNSDASSDSFVDISVQDDGASPFSAASDVSFAALSLDSVNSIYAAAATTQPAVVISGAAGHRPFGLQPYIGSPAVAAFNQLSNKALHRSAYMGPVANSNTKYAGAAGPVSMQQLDMGDDSAVLGSAAGVPPVPHYGSVISTGMSTAGQPLGALYGGNGIMPGRQMGLAAANAAAADQPSGALKWVQCWPLGNGSWQ